MKCSIYGDLHINTTQETDYLLDLIENTIVILIKQNSIDSFEL